jgi:aryl-alcohol dehydrogenase-like predicted oxidoreductase
MAPPDGLAKTLPMKTVTLTDTTIRTTALGFGTATLFRLPTARERRRVLDAAVDAGIRHFDAARSYGFGEAERELGRLAAGRRDEVVIATKFGIVPNTAVRRLSRIQGPVRRLIKAFPWLRQRLRANSSPLFEERRYDSASARLSLETSLRALGTDHVDLLFLHEPHADNTDPDEIAAFLEDARQRGLIGAWGISGEPGESLHVAAGFVPHVPVLQLRDDVLTRTWERAPASPAARISYGALSTALPTITSHLHSSPDRRAAWSEATGVDCGDPEQLAALLLQASVAANPGGAVVFSTTRVDRVGPMATACAGATEARDRLAALRTLVDAEIPSRGLTRT